MSLVCWSGGLDSTLVLHMLAVQHRDGTAWHSRGVRALTIHHPQVAMHRPSADAARAALKEKFRSLGLTIGYLDVEYTQSARSWRAENFLVGCSDNPQALLWMTTAANYLERDEDLYSGYIRTDDYWHSAGRYQQAFDTLQAVAGRTGKLVHLLEWFSKADVVRQAKELALHDLCWWCEGDLKGKKPKPCGKCKSCQTHLTALWQLKTFKPVGA